MGYGEKLRGFVEHFRKSFGWRKIKKRGVIKAKKNSVVESGNKCTVIGKQSDVSSDEQQEGIISDFFFP